jgi:hypothetical protein
MITSNAINTVVRDSSLVIRQNTVDQQLKTKNEKLYLSFAAKKVYGDR